MKKLVMILLIGICMPYLSISQTIIKIAGDVDAKMVKSQVVRSLEYLGIHEPMHLYIVYSKRMPKKLNGMTFFVPVSDTVNLIRIRINARLDKKQRTNTLAHEMLHVAQYVKGDLKKLDNHSILWEGRKYSSKNLTSRKNPWELEAYRHDQYLAKVLKETPVKVPVLVASEAKD